MRSEQFFKLSNRIANLKTFEAEIRIAARTSSDVQRKELKRLADKLGKYQSEIEKYFIELDFDAIEIKDFVNQ